MDWISERGGPTRMFQILLAAFVLVIWLVVEVMFGSTPSWREAMAVVGGGFAYAFIGNWFETHEEDGRKLRESMIRLEKKVDAVLDAQARIEEALLLMM